MAKKKQREIITLSYDFINKISESFLQESKSNPFYDKNVFFTKGLKNSTISFQIIGNLGGWADDDYSELNIQTNFYIVADSILNDLEKGLENEQINDLQRRLNLPRRKRVKDSLLLISLKRKLDIPRKKGLDNLSIPKDLQRRVLLPKYEVTDYLLIKNLVILSEKPLIDYVKKRSLAANDIVTLNLVERTI